MSKTLEEQMLEAILKDANALSGIARRDGKTNPLSKRLAENCSQVAQEYALEQQIELLGKISIDSEEGSKKLDKIYLELKSKLKSLKDGRE